MVILKLCSFDQSTTKTGYAVFNDSDLTRWGLIDCSKEDPDIKFDNMIKQIEVIIKKISPDIIVIEDVNLRTSVKVLIQLSRLQGAIIAFCLENNIEYYIYAPAQWRKILGFTQGQSVKRSELKEQAIAFVRNGYGINVGDDCAESLCIGLAYLKDNDLLPDINNLHRSRKNKGSEYREV